MPPSVVRAMARAVRIPVTVKMRAGWNDTEINAPMLARWSRTPARPRSPCTAARPRSPTRGDSDWDLIAQRRRPASAFPCSAAATASSRSRSSSACDSGGVSGVLVGRGALRNPWIFAQAADLAAGAHAARRSRTPIAAQFLLDYIDLLLHERVDERAGLPARRAGPAATGPRQRYPRAAASAG